MTRLDRPVWHSLITHHAGLSKGDAHARRFLPDVNLFASGPDDKAETMQAVAGLVGPGEQIYILQVPEIRCPDGLSPLKEALGVQMVYQGADLTGFGAEDIDVLGDDDAAEMLALAKLTEPGPFLERTHVMGRFSGIRIDGRLAAMAGERMRFPGYTEVSGVCTYPDFQGRGLARRLSAHVVRHMLARGDTPFLHAWATNEAAIGLYRSLGFEIRCHVQAAILTRPDAPQR